MQVSIAGIPAKVLSPSLYELALPTRDNAMPISAAYVVFEAPGDWRLRWIMADGREVTSSVAHKARDAAFEFLASRRPLKIGANA